MRDHQSDDDVGAGWNVLAFSAADAARRAKRSPRAADVPAPVEIPHRMEKKRLGKTADDALRYSMALVQEVRAQRAARGGNAGSTNTKPYDRIEVDR